MGGLTEPWIQCQGVTKDGFSCQRMTSFWSNNFCHSHQSQAPYVPPKPPIPKEVTNRIFYESKRDPLLLFLLFSASLLFSAQTLGAVIFCLFTNILLALIWEFLAHQYKIESKEID